MVPVDFAQLPLWQNSLVFVVSAAVIWLVGSRLSVHAAIIADKTGLGEVFVGLLLLAVATSLPEIGRTITASAIGNAPLAVDSLFGGVVLQTAVLALADLVVAQRVLTYFAPRPVLLLQGAMVVLLLGLALAGIAAGEVVHFLAIGLWSALLFGLYAFSLYSLRSYESREQWRPVNVPDELKEKELAGVGGQVDRGGHSLTRVAILFAVSSLVIFVAGVLLAQVGDALAVQTGLGASFVGATLLAFASALPEMSTTIAAARMGAYSMAISNIFGTNALLVALVFLADVFYRQGPILEAVDQSSAFVAAVGLVTTAIYLIGMIERRNRTFLGMGLDSLAVLVIYPFTLLMLYLMR